MLTVQFAGPQNLRSCPKPGRAPEGGRASPKQHGVQRRRKCETSPPPYPGTRPTRVSSPALASEGPGSHPSAPLAPGTRRKESGENRDLAEQKVYNEPSLLKRLLSPSFPSLQLSGRFTGPAAHQLHLGVPINASPFSWVSRYLPWLIHHPAPAGSRANPEPVWCGLHLAFSIIVLTFCPAK